MLTVEQEMKPITKCKYCSSINIRKEGKTYGKGKPQSYVCLDCEKTFVIEPF